MQKKNTAATTKGRFLSQRQISRSIFSSLPFPVQELDSAPSTSAAGFDYLNSNRGAGERKQRDRNNRSLALSTHPSLGTAVLVRNVKRCFVGRITGLPPAAPPDGISMLVVS